MQSERKSKKRKREEIENKQSTINEYFFLLINKNKENEQNRKRVKLSMNDNDIQSIILDNEDKLLFPQNKQINKNNNIIFNKQSKMSNEEEKENGGNIEFYDKEEKYEMVVNNEKDKNKNKCINTFKNDYQNINHNEVNQLQCQICKNIIKYTFGLFQNKKINQFINKFVCGECSKQYLENENLDKTELNLKYTTSFKCTLSG